jgi:hypothetical protein
MCVDCVLASLRITQDDIGRPTPSPRWFYHRVDRPGTRETKSRTEKITFTRACLSNIRVIMVITRVPLVELLISDIDGMDSSTRVPAVRRVWAPAVLPYHARHLKLLPCTGAVLPTFPSAEGPWVRLLGARICPRPGYEEGS